MTQSTDTKTAKWVGQSIPRREDPRLLRGQGRYIADLNLAGVAYAAFVRSPHAHARILSVDTSKAEQLPGVLAVITGREIGAVVKKPAHAEEAGEGRAQVPLVDPLAADKVLYVGNPVALVVAESKYTAEDATDLVEVEYEPLPAVVDPEAAIGPGATKLYEHWRDNVAWRAELGGGDVEAAFRDADFVFSERFYAHRTGATPIEPRGIVATYDEVTGLTVHIPSQRPHMLRLSLADLLDLPTELVRVIVPRDVGGSFGCKSAVYREDVAICYAAMRLKRPVRWIENRMESLLSIGHERDQIHYLEVAVRRDGRILGVKDRIVADVGCGGLAGYIGAAMPQLGAAYLANAYDIKAMRIDLTCVVTNKPMVTPNRAFGEFPGRFAMDYALHLIARELELDPREVFLCNLIRTFPYVLPTGITYDIGDYDGAVRKLLAAIDYDGVKAEQAEARKQGRYIGVGFSLGCETSGASSEFLVPLQNQPGYGAATVKVDARGRVQILEGDAPSGTGHETVLAQVVADELGVHVDEVHLTFGDTASTPFSVGSIANRGASYTASALVLACRKLKQKMGTIAAHLLGVAARPEEFVFAEGSAIWQSDPTKRASLREIATAAILLPTKLPPGVEAGLEATAHFEPQIRGMYSISVHGVVVEVDPASGEFKIRRYVVVDDAGVPINPMLVRGQVHGGVVMGIGNTCFERYSYTDEGQPISTTLMDYHLPSAADVPEIETLDHSIPSPYTPLGTKGKGEGIPGPVPAALVSAITDAIDRPGFRLTTLPLTPEAVWRALQQGSGARG